MTKEEFCRAACIEDISQGDYAMIEQVYAHHPSITNGEGKTDIAKIYRLNGGMRIIRDMLPTANRAEEIETEIFHLRTKIATLVEARDNL